MNKDGGDEIDKILEAEMEWSVKNNKTFRYHTVREAINDWVWAAVEPCEPECTLERHAYHAGQWDMAKKLTGRNHP